MKREKLRLRPTGLWLIFGPVLGCMWLAAINYSNNLVYAILYLVASLSFISIFHTWRNLGALRIEHVRIQPAFAGEDVRVEIFLRNVSKHSIYGFFFASIGDDIDSSRRWKWGRPLEEVLRSRRTRLLRGPDDRGIRLAPEDSRPGDAFPADGAEFIALNRCLCAHRFRSDCFGRASACRWMPNTLFTRNRRERPTGPGCIRAATPDRRKARKRVMIFQESAPTCRGNPCGTSIGKPSRGAGRFR